MIIIMKVKNFKNEMKSTPVGQQLEPEFQGGERLSERAWTRSRKRTAQNRS